MAARRSLLAAPCFFVFFLPRADESRLPASSAMICIEYQQLFSIPRNASIVSNSKLSNVSIFSCSHERNPNALTSTSQDLGILVSAFSELRMRMLSSRFDKEDA
uniref:Putative secreted protein n=1 Tax=Anopheles marajoara TaxID=58244 RepID=A0A2M4C9G4_9DIPT